MNKLILAVTFVGGVLIGGGLVGYSLQQKIDALQAEVEPDISQPAPRNEPPADARLAMNSAMTGTMNGSMNANYQRTIQQRDAMNARNAVQRRKVVTPMQMTDEELREIAASVSLELPSR